MLKLKPVVAGCATFQIHEDADYKQHLCRTVIKGAEPEIFGLYRVDSLFAHAGFPHHVLAESLEGAIGQATCQDDDPRYFTATRLPLIVRGWGKNEF